ncbi:hypothetical protein SAMN02744133_108115 [Thalassospira xiamenensis M-5 = DSM 17429]|uniref:Conjugal transfer protein TraQ n=1 Tax=Thalassospira xiamenensis M-5 = DSM 17429 TaxID=1123366 RepID=A0AB72UJ96_9PROT|nr:hypothetical protein [Thalassospira xiamenensis]AJD54388.1 hypothetical protein TH3_21578 [Thalassospira xiamenensis M-5 = DSM 17429]SIT21824.1 hypothetical protein SAMN02744133_108115 [Thalassospira xiamenensis M-5 = DSM 17429]
MLDQIVDRLSGAASAFAEMATNLASILPGLINIVGWSTALIGIFICLGAVVALYDATRDGKSMMNSQVTPLQACGVFLVGGAIISFSTTLGVMSQSTFGSFMGFVGNDVTFTFLGQKLDENGQRTMRALFQWVWFLGFIFALKGVLDLKGLIERKGNASIWKCLAQIIGGSFCLNSITVMEQLIDLKVGT